MRRLTFLAFVILSLVHFSEQRTIPSKEVEQENGSDDVVGAPTTRGFDKVVVDEQYTWYGGIVYYCFYKDTGDLVRQKVYLAMETLTGGTNSLIVFRNDCKRSSDVLVIYDGSVELQTKYAGRGCRADRGYKGGREQTMILSFGPSSKNCGDGKNGAGIALHFLMHALGFVHEFQRNDRDSYLTLAKEKIMKTFHFTEAQYADNFDKRDDYTYGPYNYKSIMNFDLASYITTKPNPPNKPNGVKENMGQLCGLSATDLNQLDAAYRRTVEKATRIPGRTTRYTDFYPIRGGSEDCKDKLKPMDDGFE